MKLMCENLYVDMYSKWIIKMVWKNLLMKGPEIGLSMKRGGELAKGVTQTPITENRGKFINDMLHWNKIPLTKDIL